MGSNLYKYIGFTIISNVFNSLCMCMTIITVFDSFPSLDKLSC